MERNIEALIKQWDQVQTIEKIEYLEIILKEMDTLEQQDPLNQRDWGFVNWFRFPHPKINQTGLEIFAKYFLNNPTLMALDTESLINTLLIKIMCSNKLQLKQQGLALLLGMLENFNEKIRVEIFSIFSSKSPKAILACLELLNASIESRPQKPDFYKDFIKEIVELTNNTNPEVRHNSMVFLAEVHKKYFSSFESIFIQNLSKINRKKFYSMLEVSGGKKNEENIKTDAFQARLADSPVKGSSDPHNNLAETTSEMGKLGLEPVKVCSTSTKEILPEQKVLTSKSQDDKLGTGPPMLEGSQQFQKQQESLFNHDNKPVQSRKNYNYEQYFIKKHNAECHESRPLRKIVPMPQNWQEQIKLNNDEQNYQLYLVSGKSEIFEQISLEYRKKLLQAQKRFQKPVNCELKHVLDCCVSLTYLIRDQEFIQTRIIQEQNQALFDTYLFTINKYFNQSKQALNYYKQSNEYLDYMRSFFQEFNSEESFLTQYYWSFDNWLTVKNSNLQEKCIDLIILLLKKLNNNTAYTQALKDLKQIFEVRVNTSNPNQINKCDQLLMQIFEKGYRQQIFDLFFSQLKPTQPMKVIKNTLQLLTVFLNNFGFKNMQSLQQIFPLLATLSYAQKEQVRKSVFDFYVEVYRWMGETLKPYLLSLKPIQLSELEQRFSQLDKQDCPKKPLKFPQETYQIHQKQEFPVWDPSSNLFNAKDDAEIQMKSNWVKNMIIFLYETKQYEILFNKEALDRIVVDAQDLDFNQEDFFGNFMDAFIELLNDYNIHIVHNVLLALGYISKKLKRKFCRPAHALLVYVLQKSKDNQLDKSIVFKCAKGLAKSLMQLEDKSALAGTLLKRISDPNLEIKKMSIQLLNFVVEKDEETQLVKPVLFESALNELLLAQMAANKDPIVKAYLIDLIAQLKYVYQEEFVEETLVNLKKNDLSRIENSVQKYEWKKEMKIQNFYQKLEEAEDKKLEPPQQIKPAQENKIAQGIDEV